MYDVSKHPDYLSKKKTKEKILSEFLDNLTAGEKGKGEVSYENFEDYYANISASVDSDDYFELMMRNAWHISGGEGVCANSSNKRVLVTNADGSQSVVEIKNDLGLKAGDKAGMMARLQAQVHPCHYCDTSTVIHPFYLSLHTLLHTLFLLAYHLILSLLTPPIVLLTIIRGKRMP